MIQKIDIPIYGNTLWFADFESVTEDFLYKAAKKVFTSSSAKENKEYASRLWANVFCAGNKKEWSYHGMCTGDGALVLIIVDNLKLNSDNINTISHEIFHAADRILRNRGFDLVDGSQEAWSYLIGFISEKIFTPLFLEK